jgi:DNA-binding transcriptional ArsR family regulator
MTMLSLQALGDPTRQRIVELLAQRALCAGDIVKRVDLSAPAVSQHLRTLREANLVRVHVDAQRRIYELNLDGVNELSAWVDRLRAFWSTKLDALEGALRDDDRKKSTGKRVATPTKRRRAKGKTRR